MSFQKLKPWNFGSIIIKNDIDKKKKKKRCPEDRFV